MASQAHGQIHPAPAGEVFSLGRSENTREVTRILSRTPEGRADRTRFSARRLRLVDPGTGQDRSYRNRQGTARAGLSTVQEKANYSGIFQAQIGRNCRGLTHRGDYLCQTIYTKPLLMI